MQKAEQSSTLTLLFVIGFCILACYLYSGGHFSVQSSQNASYASQSTDNIMGRPTLSVGQINTILAAYQSPAAGTGQVLYDLGVQYGVNPAVALAFFWHESSFGTQGVAVITRSLGNMRCMDGYSCYHDPRNDGDYAAFSSWQQGYEAWYGLITGPVYVGSGLMTFSQVIPKYAPAGDFNDEQAYVASLRHAVGAWSAGEVRI